MDIRSTTESISVKLERLTNWRLRQKIGTLLEVMSTEIVPFSLQLEERRFFDAADSLLASYGSAKELIEIMDNAFPEIADMGDE
jgi:hypothetical protein